MGPRMTAFLGGQRRTYTILLFLFLLVPTVQAAVINVKDLGATGNGSTDDGAAINNALAQGCSTGNDVYFPVGVYFVSSPLNTIGCSLTVYGDGSSSSVLKLGGPGSSIYSPLLNFSGVSNNVVVHDLGLQGQHVHAVGLQLAPLNSANIYNVIIQNFGIAGYSAGNQIAEDGLYAAGVQNLTVANSVVSGNERSGIEMIPVSNATISGNIISDNGYYAGVAEWLDPSGTAGPLNICFLNNIARNNGSGGFDVETGSSLTTAYGKIHGNDIEDCGFDMWTYGVGAVIGNNAYGEISNNIVHNFNQTGPKYGGYGTAVVGTPAGSMVMTNNYVSNTGDYGIIVNGTGGPATITGNWSSFAPTAGLDADTFSGGTINNNYSFSNSGPAFEISGCNGCTTSPNFTSAPSDTVPPTVPTGLTPSVASRDQINLSWTDSTHNIGVKGYYVYRNGTQIAQTAGTQYPDTGLAAGTQYTYMVAAFDGSGNVSAQSPCVAATTLGGSSIKPL
jgi:parallel beta-helix repeat protein